MLDAAAVNRTAQAVAAASNSETTQAVAAFHAEDGEIIITRGEPWSGHARVRDMTAAFTPTSRPHPDLH